MTQALGLRATSFALSAGVLGLAVVAALTMTITMNRAPTLEFDAPIVPIVEPPRTEPPPPTPTRTSAPPETAEPAPTELPTPPQTHEISTPSPPDIWAPPGPPEVTNPDWLRRPRDLERYYPTRALTRGVEGDVVLDCRVLTSGDLTCGVVSETPPNWGFGAAALRISRDYRMVPATQDGAPVEARYRMRVPFRVQ
ncbi:MAG: TonB family protein [Hyphomonadaceae bacterium]